MALIDHDNDGDTDIYVTNGPGAANALYENQLVETGSLGFDRGYLQVCLNDGSGHFNNAPVALNEYSSAAWMALGFGDLDCAGTTDVFLGRAVAPVQRYGGRKLGTAENCLSFVTEGGNSASARLAAPMPRPRKTRRGRQGPVSRRIRPSGHYAATR